MGLMVSGQPAGVRWMRGVMAGRRVGPGADRFAEQRRTWRVQLEDVDRVVLCVKLDQASGLCVRA